MKVFTGAELTPTPFLNQTSRIVSGIIPTLITCALFFILHQIATAQTVHIPDRNLKAALVAALGKKADAGITRAEMKSLEALDAFESGIRSLKGLEYAINLTELHLGYNRISDLSPLKNLTNLEILDLHINGRISDVSPLKDLINLQWLSLRGNQISDISPLKDLTDLTYLHLAVNHKISDVSPVSTMTNLTFLDIELNDTRLGKNENFNTIVNTDGDISVQIYSEWGPRFNLVNIGADGHWVTKFDSGEFQGVTRDIRSATFKVTLSPDDPRVVGLKSRPENAQYGVYIGYQPETKRWTLITQNRDQAAHSDGKNEFGEQVASGVYICELTTPRFQQTKRLVVVK